MDERNDDALTRLDEAYQRALRLEKQGRKAAAAEAYRAMLAIDPEDHAGASVRLAALGRGDAPDRAPPAYVATLFDQHAEEFDEILVEQLGYAIPLELRERLRAVAPGPYARLLDLGCGTGLAGMALADITAHRTGVDLAEAIVAQADAREVYDALFVGDAVAFLEQSDEAWDLIVATDVLPYLGDAGPLFRAARARSVAGGVFGFSTETLPARDLKGRAWMVGPGHRFAHDPAYIVGALEAAGFETVEIEPAVIRAERGKPTPGHLAIARAV